VIRVRILVFLGLLGFMTSTMGCSVRETQTDRTSTDQFLLSKAASRAVSQFSNAFAKIKNKRVYVDATFFESHGKEYVVGALRHHLNENGVFLVPKEPEEYEFQGKKVTVGPQYIVEVRAAALGNRESNFGFGAPYLPIPIPETSVITYTQALYVINRRLQEGWAKFQLWIYDAESNEYVAQSKDLWGKAYYAQWWFFLLGPFDFSNDLYPEPGEVGQNRYPGSYKGAETGEDSEKAEQTKKGEVK
jgi:hypothetical protein